MRAHRASTWKWVFALGAAAVCIFGAYYLLLEVANAGRNVDAYCVAVEQYRDIKFGEVGPIGVGSVEEDPGEAARQERATAALNNAGAHLPRDMLDVWNDSSVDSTKTAGQQELAAAELELYTRANCGTGLYSL